MTLMVFECLRSINEFNDESVLYFKHWMKFIQLIYAYSSDLPLNKITFTTLPLSIQIEDN